MNPQGYCRTCQQDVPARRGPESLGQVWICGECSDFLTMVWWPEDRSSLADSHEAGAVTRYPLPEDPPR